MCRRPPQTTHNAVDERVAVVSRHWWSPTAQLGRPTTSIFSPNRKTWSPASSGRQPIDLANEDLIRSHFHAVWLAETGVKLGRSVREVLDREKLDELPLRQDLAEQIEVDHVVRNAEGRARRILETLSEDLSKQFAPWYTETLARQYDKLRRKEALNRAFNRWRSLYRATSSQIKSANAILNNPAGVRTEPQRGQSPPR